MEFRNFSPPCFLNRLKPIVKLKAMRSCLLRSVTFALCFTYLCCLCCFFKHMLKLLFCLSSSVFYIIVLWRTWPCTWKNMCFWCISTLSESLDSFFTLLIRIKCLVVIVYSLVSIEKHIEIRISIQINMIYWFFPKHEIFLSIYWCLKICIKLLFFYEFYSIK